MQMIADLADRIHVLDYGRTIANGSPQSVLNDPSVDADQRCGPHADRRRVMGLMPDLMRPQEAIEVAPDATPLDFLQAVYRSANVALHSRLKAAIEAAQYVHPRLSVTASMSGQNYAELLSKAASECRGCAEDD
jgi:ABC-type glutathione transport system ATPase component